MGKKRRKGKRRKKRQKDKGEEEYILDTSKAPITAEKYISKRE